LSQVSRSCEVLGHGIRHCKASCSARSALGRRSGLGARHAALRRGNSGVPYDSAPSVDAAPASPEATRAAGTRPETSRRRQVLVRDRLQPVSTLLPIGGSLPRRVVGGYGYTTRTAHRRGRRIAVPLAGSSLQMFASRTRRRDSRPNVRVVVGERVVFYVAEWVPCERRPEGRTIGVDKGMNTLLVASDGAVDSAKAFGRDASRQLEEIINTSARRRNRLRIAAYERSIRNSNRSRSRLIRRRNLGRRKQARTRTRESSGLRDFVNRSLNELFEDLGISRIYAEDLTFRPGWPGREINRRLSRWLRGYLQRRLVYKAELNGVELETVNAAYTSQTCPRCWFVAKSNRHGDRFSCSNCGYAGSADAIAATNVRQRGSDSVITRFMSATEVKQTLDARWRSARIGRAWDSNEAISRPSRASTTRIESRTAAGEVQTPPVIHTAALYPPAVVVAEQEAPDAYSVKNASFV